MPLHRILTAAVAIMLLAMPTAVADTPTRVGTEIDTGNGEVVAHLEFEGATEIDYDGERYAFVGQFNGKYDRANVNEFQEGGLRVIDMVGDPDEGIEPFEQVGYLNCPGTDNYIRYMDPEVFDGDYVVMAFHGNWCTREALLDDPHTTAGYGARNGIAVIDVSDPTDPTIVDTIGHWSAHTVMPHPTRPYLYILPGGLANGAAVPSRISPTGIIDASDPTDLKYVTSYEHNLTGCHDLGFSADGDYAFCAGAGEIQTWDIAGDKIESPEVVGTIVNPAIMFPHNAVVSPSGQYLVINDEAFGFHTCTDAAADLYGSLWIYDISIPEVPVLAGRIHPPAHPSQSFGAYTDWVEGWCAAHNYNFVPGTDIVVASWFAGGMTAHDISDPLFPELIAAYQPDAESVMWSAHYYGGYVLTGDMALGTEVLDIPELRAAEQAAAAAADSASIASSLGAAALSPAAGTQALAPRVDRSDLLIPAVLPDRPVRPQGLDPAFCVIPRAV